MKKYLFILISLGLVFSCSTKAIIPTGDMQFFELRGNVLSLDKEYFFPNRKASFDKDGYLIINTSDAIVEHFDHLDNYYMLQEDDGPFKMVKFDFIEPDFYSERGPVMEYKDLIYDSFNRLVEIGSIYNSTYLYYNTEGQLCSIVDTAEGGMVSDFTYDKNGTCIKKRCFAPQIMSGYINRYQVREEDCTYEYSRHRFDKHGNWVARWVVTKSADGKVIEEKEEFRDGLIEYYDEE